MIWQLLMGRFIVIPEVLQKQVLEQFHINHMGIETTKLLACESIQWIHLNVNIENHIKNCSTYSDFQQTQLKENLIHHEISGKP